MTARKKMNPEVKAAWVAALRSGDYKQTKFKLRDVSTGGFCCLGVLCEISGLGTWDERDVTPQFIETANPKNRNSGVLTSGVMRWAGLTNRIGMYRRPQDDTAGESLSRDNDRGKTFAEIADIIEAKF